MKRGLDIFVSLGLLILLLPAFALIAARIRRDDGGPAFYRSERMTTMTKGFQLLKFRTMSPVDSGTTDHGVSGGDKSDRVTAIGKMLRARRLDELPQLINILRGDMSLVGPRPPLRQYTDAYPDIYGRVLRDKPGVTGLGSLFFARHEERILATASSASQTDALYRRRCIPRKARLDGIYQTNRTLWLDLLILYWTAARFVSLPGRRARRMRSPRLRRLNARVTMAPAPDS